MNEIISTPPLQRAKEIWYTFYKKENHNFFTAKVDAIALIETYIKESQFANDSDAVIYWEEVKKQAENL